MHLTKNAIWMLLNSIISCHWELFEWLIKLKSGGNHSLSGINKVYGETYSLRYWIKKKVWDYGNKSEKFGIYLFMKRFLQKSLEYVWYCHSWFPQLSLLDPSRCNVNGQCLTYTLCKAMSGLFTPFFQIPNLFSGTNCIFESSSSHM